MGLAVSLLWVGSAAQATQYAWCDASVRGHGYFISGIVEVEEGQDAWVAFQNGLFGREFARAMAEQYGGDGSHPDCSVRGSYAEAKSVIEKTVRANPQTHYTVTDWTGNRSAARDHGEENTRPDPNEVDIVMPGGSVKSSRSVTNSSAASDNRAKDEADFRAKQAAYEAAVQENRKAQAEYDRKQAEFRAKQAEQRARAEAELRDWKKRSAACKAGDRAQCASHASTQ